MPRRLAVVVPVLAGLSALVSLPAQAQMYVRPYGGVYVERYYGPPPAYYPPPPVYYPPAAYPPPAYGAPGRFPFADIAPMLRSMGMSGIGAPRVDGNTYLVDATARSGARMRVRIDAYSGQVIAMHPIGQGPAGAAPSAPARQALPTVAPLPPARPPELAAIPAPEPSAEALPAAAPDTAPPPASTPTDPATPAAAPPASPAAAAGAAESTPPAASPGAIRIIPGTAVPPSAKTSSTPSSTPSSAPSSPPAESADAAPESPPAIPPAGSGTGTGVGTGSTVPAGTASVYARGAPAKAVPSDD